MYHKRGQTKAEREKVVIGQFGDSFLKVMDREAATRMSGRHWTNPIS